MSSPTETIGKTNLIDKLSCGLCCKKKEKTDPIVTKAFKALQEMNKDVEKVTKIISDIKGFELKGDDTEIAKKATKIDEHITKKHIDLKTDLEKKLGDENKGLWKNLLQFTVNKVFEEKKKSEEKKGEKEAPLITQPPKIEPEEVKEKKE